MPDGEFFAAIAEAADCGVLLDLTNLWVNDRNGRANIGDVLAKLPLQRVLEVHSKFPPRNERAKSVLDD